MPSVPLPIFSFLIAFLGASLVAQIVKNLPEMLVIWVLSLGQEDPLDHPPTTLLLGVSMSLTTPSTFCSSLLVAGLFHLVECSQDSSMLYHMSKFPSFLKAE